MRKHILLSILALTFTIAACQNANTPPANEASPPQTKQTVRTKQTAPSKDKNESAEATAKRLTKLALRTPQVNDATAIVLGNYAIVGIDVDATLDRSRVGTIKYTVAEALQEDPAGANALVTSDPDIMQRIKEMNADIRKGRPIAGIMEELADIAGRLIPMSPQNVQQNKEEPSDRTNQQRINQSNQAKQPPRGQ